MKGFRDGLTLALLYVAVVMIWLVLIGAIIWLVEYLTP